MSDYAAFLESKALAAPLRGLPSSPVLSPHLFKFQKHCTDFALRAGSSGCFLSTGLGKTEIELEWCEHAAGASNGRALILTPLAVARQIEAEGKRWGYLIRVIREQDEAGDGINVCNYDRFERLDPAAFGAVALDESSILKSFMGKTSRALIAAFAGHRWRLSATATPAPNDHMEIGTQAEFLGVMTQADMLIRWFKNDSGDTGQWLLKGHARKDFWAWMASWCRMAEHPRDLGDDIDGFDLEPLNVVRHRVETPEIVTGGLFGGAMLSATDVHRVKRQTAEARAARAADLALADRSPWVVWCDTDYEADAIMAALKGEPGVVEVRGSHPITRKEDSLAAFADGTARVVVTKPSVAGWGLNWQHCANVAFVGRSFSYEAWYQAVRRCWRFGQKNRVNVHLIVAEGEDQIGRVIDRKADDHARMKVEMVNAMRGAMGKERVRIAYAPSKIVRYAGRDITCLGAEEGDNYTAIHGDCVNVARQLPDFSVGFSVFSPPFSNLFVYSDSIADMGNSADDGEFEKHYAFLVAELARVTKPGRLCAVHCSDLPTTKWKDGVIGIKDFSGTLIRIHEAAGWTLHSRVTIWKCPVVEMTRTKALGLLYKQLKKDSTRSRQGLADYLLVFRAPGENTEPVTHSEADFPLDRWQQWASPVWMDVNQSKTLNVEAARDPADERHICPLQTDLIERALHMWSNRGDLVLSPFMGIGSEGVSALRLRRRFLGIELKESYFRQAVKYLESEDRQRELALA